MCTVKATVLVASIVFVSAAAAGAMVAVKRDFPDLVARAEQIVVGTVTDIRHEQDEIGAPFTLVTFADLTVLKGAVGPTLTLRISGGPAGDVEVRIADMPSFTLGERSLLFVAGNGRDICPLVGVWQGRFRVRFDPAVGAEIVEDSTHQPLTGLHGRELQSAGTRSNAEHAAPITLDAFRQLVADELAHPQSEAH